MMNDEKEEGFSDSRMDGMDIPLDTTPQMVEEVAEAIIEKLLDDDRFKALFSISRQRRQDDIDRSHKKKDDRQKNTELPHVLLRDIIPSDNRKLISSIKQHKFAQEYLQIVEVLYREFEVEYRDFPTKGSKRFNYLSRNPDLDSDDFSTLMRVETFMLALLLQPVPAFVESISQTEQTKQETVSQLLKRLTHLGEELLFLWDQQEFIRQLDGNYFTRNVKILAEFFKVEEQRTVRARNQKYFTLRQDVTFDALTTLNHLLGEIKSFAETGKHDIGIFNNRLRDGDEEPVTAIVKPNRIEMDKKWNQRSEQLQTAITHFQQYKNQNIMLYRFKIELGTKDHRITYEQFKSFFSFLNKKAMKPEGFKGYLNFLYFWKENFRTDNLIQDLVVIFDASKLMELVETEIGARTNFRDIPNEFQEYIDNLLVEKLDIFDGKKPTLHFEPLPLLQSHTWNIPAEFIIEAGDKQKWRFFERYILPYFIYLEVFEVDYTDEIRARFSRGRK